MSRGPEAPPSAEDQARSGLEDLVRSPHRDAAGAVTRRAARREPRLRA